MQEKINERIKEFLEENFLFEFDNTIGLDTDLFKEGIIDSFGYIQLIQFLESEFNIQFTESEMLTNVLISYNDIQEAVAKLSKERLKKEEL